jgi:ankyrin repeat protein
LQKKYPEAVKILLENGADPNIQDGSGQTALFLSIRKVETCRLLLEYGADPNIQNIHGSTAIMCKNTDKCVDKTIQLLLDYKADPTIKDKYGMDAVTSTQRFILAKKIDILEKELELIKLSPLPGDEFMRLFHEENPNSTFEDFLSGYIPILRQIF